MSEPPPLGSAATAAGALDASGAALTGVAAVLRRGRGRGRGEGRGAGVASGVSSVDVGSTGVGSAGVGSAGVGGSTMGLGLGLGAGGMMLRVAMTTPSVPAGLENCQCDQPSSKARCASVTASVVMPSVRCSVGFIGRMRLGVDVPRPGWCGGHRGAARRQGWRLSNSFRRLAGRALLGRHGAGPPGHGGTSFRMACDLLQPFHARQQLLPGLGRGQPEGQ